jgi:hypothetical protein
VIFYYSCILKYLNYVADSNSIRKLSTDTFERPKLGVVPGFRFTREIVETETLLNQNYGMKTAQLPLKMNDQNSVYVVQDSDNYTKMFVQGTSKFSRGLTVYYPLSLDTILVDAYLLSHLYNVPPGAVGGTKELKKSFMQSYEDVVQRERSYLR